MSSHERALIKDMMVLLESTDMSPLQRQSDNLIGRAKELLAQPEYIADVGNMVEPVATKLESHQFTAFHVSADDFKKLQKLPTGTRIYTAPHKRDPMTGSEISQGFKADKDAINAESYWAGVALAEKHYGVKK
jgi:hypothetical protein